MKVRDLIKLDIDLDITTNIYDDPYCAFVGPQPITRYGESYWEDVLNLECEISDEAPVAVIIIPEGEEAEEINDGIKEFFSSCAGYCSIPDYQSWFGE